jgi:hypothetical protein
VPYAQLGVQPLTMATPSAVEDELPQALQEGVETMKPASAQARVTDLGRPTGLPTQSGSAAGVACSSALRGRLSRSFPIDFANQAVAMIVAK